MSVLPDVYGAQRAIACDGSHTEAGVHSAPSPLAVQRPQPCSVLSPDQSLANGCGRGRRLCVAAQRCVSACVCAERACERACSLSPSPALEAPSSKSSRVPPCEFRYVAGTQPCSSAVLTNHQPVQRKHDRTTLIFFFCLEKLKTIIQVRSFPALLFAFFFCCQP